VTSLTPADHALLDTMTLSEIKLIRDKNHSRCKSPRSIPLTEVTILSVNTALVVFLFMLFSISLTETEARDFSLFRTHLL